MKIKEIIHEHIEVANSLIGVSENIENICNVCLSAIQSGKKIILAGNGGSAADSQHIAAEFVGRFVKERKSLPAIALTTDTSALTAIANDYGYDEVFSRQLSSIGKKDDVFIAISTSGNSKNLIQAIKVAKSNGILTIGLLGNSGGKINNLVDFPLIVNSDITARIQEMHILIGHLICDYVDKEY